MPCDFNPEGRRRHKQIIMVHFQYVLCSELFIEVQAGGPRSQTSLATCCLLIFLALSNSPWSWTVEDNLLHMCLAHLGKWGWEWVRGGMGLKSQKDGKLGLGWWSLPEVLSQHGNQEYKNPVLCQMTKWYASYFCHSFNLDFARSQNELLCFPCSESLVLLLGSKGCFLQRGSEIDSS